jgi:hypothetical protein
VQPGELVTRPSINIGGLLSSISSIGSIGIGFKLKKVNLGELAVS